MTRVKRAAFLLLFSVLFFVAAGCHKAAPAPPDAAVVLTPVAAPQGRVADVVVSTPDATWSKLQRGIGGPLGLLPGSFGGLVCALTGIDLARSGEMDGASPAFVVIALDGTTFTFASAVKLKDARHTRDVLADAEDARFTPRSSGAITVLDPKGGATLPLSIGLVEGGYLLFARDEASLTRLGPYAYRTLPTHALPDSAFYLEAPHDALAGPLHETAARSWGQLRDAALRNDDDQRAQHGGRAPDYGDPRAIVQAFDTPMQHLFAFMADLDVARLAIKVLADDLEAVITVVPSAGGGPSGAVLAALATGDAAPLGTLPKDTVVGLISRDDVTHRQDDAKKLTAGVAGGFGDRLPPGDRKKLEAAMNDWANVRGDWLVAGLVWGAEPSLVGRTRTADVALAKKTMREIVELTGLPAIQEPLQAQLGIGKGGFALGSDGAGFDVAAFVRESRGPKGVVPRPNLTVLWHADGDELELATGNTSEGAKTLVSDRRLGEDALVMNEIKAIEGNATFALLARPFILASPPDGSPVSVAWGRKGADGWGRVHFSYLLARAALKRLSGF